MPGGYSDYGEGIIQDYIWGIATAASPPNPYISLHTANPLDVGANEVAGGSYARQQISPSRTLNEITNTALLRWDLLPAATITHWAAWDASSGGNVLAQGALGGTRRYFCGKASSENLESVGHGLVLNDRVEFESPPNGSLPGGLTPLTVLYHVISAGLTADVLRVSLTQGGGAVDLTSDGEGLLIRVTPKIVGAGDSLEIAPSGLTHRVD